MFDAVLSKGATITMYQQFYGLKEKPFALTPDPQFLYLSESHRTAMESLLYGIYQRGGFIVLTGDIGTGKTTICRAILEKFDDNVKTAVVFNSFLTREELLESILQDFGCPSNGKSKKERIDALNKFLIQQLSQGKNAVLIIDEAQNLSAPVLEQIRMLSNLETEKEKMLQIVMLGQLELNQKLQSPELKQLNQRIAIRHQLLPLSRTEMESYIYQRLMVAGAQGNITFSRSAFNEIYGFSKGIPRLINLLCDRALLGGFVDQTDHINKRIVKKARASLLGNELRQPSSGFSPFRARAISWRIALLFISLFLFAGITLKGLPVQTAKNLFTEKIQGIYLQVSGIPPRPAPKMEPPRQTQELDHTFYWSQYPIPEDQLIHSETPGPLGTLMEVRNK